MKSLFIQFSVLVAVSAAFNVGKFMADYRQSQDFPRDFHTFEREIERVENTPSVGGARQLDVYPTDVEQSLLMGPSSAPWERQLAGSRSKHKSKLKGHRKAAAHRAHKRHSKNKKRHALAHRRHKKAHRKARAAKRGHRRHSRGRSLAHHRSSSHSARVLQTDKKKGKDYMDTIQKYVNYVPKAVGIEVNDKDPEDQRVSAIGTGMLGYGLYNNMARSDSFEKLQTILRSNIQSRELYLESIHSQITQMHEINMGLGICKRRLGRIQNLFADSIMTKVKPGYSIS